MDNKNKDQEDKRLVVELKDGVLIEDDGGFMNFMPYHQPCDLGMIMGFGMFDEDEEETPEPTVDNVIDFQAAKLRLR
jgi:hypothetical protein